MKVAVTASWAAPTKEGACAVTAPNQTAAATVMASMVAPTTRARTVCARSGGSRLAATVAACVQAKSETSAKVTNAAAATMSWWSASAISAAAAIRVAAEATRIGRRITVQPPRRRSPTKAGSASATAKSTAALPTTAAAWTTSNAIVGRARSPADTTTCQCSEVFWKAIPPTTNSAQAQSTRNSARPEAHACERVDIEQQRVTVLRPGRQAREDQQTWIVHRPESTTWDVVAQGVGGVTPRARSPRAKQTRSGGRQGGVRASAGWPAGRCGYAPCALSRAGSGPRRGGQG